MSDDLIKNLRSVSDTEAPYANGTVRPWCHQAADTIERLTRERDEARAAISALLDMHAAHHNSPIHAAARRLIAPDPANG